MKMIDLHEKELVGGTHFHMKDFVRILLLAQRSIASLKWTIDYVDFVPVLC